MLNKSVGSAFGELPFCWEEMWYIWGGRKQPTTATREQYLETELKSREITIDTIGSL